MLTALHLRGEVAVAGRTGGQRLWDVAERALPHTEALPLRTAERQLAERRFRALGVRSSPAGWEAHPDAVDGEVPDRVTLLSPFDRLIHDRDRAESLFGFRYRLEMFVPKAKREFGYYVLPILRGDELIGRIEPVFDHRRRVLSVNGGWAETRATADAGRGSARRSTSWPPGSGPRLSRSAGASRACGRRRCGSEGAGAGRLGLERPRLPWAPMDFETRAIHAGQEPDPATGAVITPIYQTSTFAQEAVGVHKGYDYARVANPTRTALEECLASLENAAHGHAYSSGIGATTTIMHLVDPGDRVVCVNDVYGGTYRMFSQVYEPKGYRFSYVTPEELSTEAAAHVEGARLVWIESPTNPLLNVVDIAAVAEAAHAAGALLVVDNTFATPYLQTPLELGADIVVHSTTKYLGGHSDVIGGFAATNDPTVAERLAFLQKSLGAVPGPFDAWLVLRGVKTLAVRMERHCENARRVVTFLSEHPRVDRVLWPGLPDHPGHAIAARQMRDFGGMVSFLVESEEEAVELVARTSVWTLAESLGGVESLIEHPARMTHASTATGPFAAPANLVRLSVGIESADDLVEDLAQALAATPARA